MLPWLVNSLWNSSLSSAGPRPGGGGGVPGEHALMKSDGTAEGVQFEKPSSALLILNPMASPALLLIILN